MVGRGDVAADVPLGLLVGTLVPLGRLLDPVFFLPDPNGLRNLTIVTASHSDPFLLFRSV